MIFVIIIIAVSMQAQRRNMGYQIKNVLNRSSTINNEEIILRYKQSFNANPLSEQNSVAPPKFKFCSYCGTKMNQNASFCAECGGKLAK
jgi:membrane protease subunit (stomatin/prohibitin family)